LARFLQVNDPVRVIVQHAFTQELEGFVEVETCPTGSEAGHEDVEVGRHGDVFFLMLVVHFHEVVIDDRHVTDIQGVGIQETVEGLRAAEFFDLGLVEKLTKLAPHGIQYHLGQSAQTFIFLDLVVLQSNALVLIVLADVLLAFGLVIAHPFGPSAGFLLDFQPSVDVVLEETLTGFRGVLHLVDVLVFVPQLNGFLQFGSAPRTRQGALVFGVCALVISLQGRFFHFVLHAGGTERKGEFTGMTVR